MASIKGENSKPVDVVNEFDVGWPLLRYGNRFSWSFCDPDDAQIEEITDTDVFASEIAELTADSQNEGPPPTVFLKPCRQLEMNQQYSSTRRSITGQLSALKGRLDKIAEDHGFRHSRARFKERNDKLPSVDIELPSPQTSFQVRKEAHVEDSFELPLYSSFNHNAVAVPFKWEDAPGKAKIDRVVRMPEALQLPPRLAPVRQQLNPSSMHCQVP